MSGSGAPSRSLLMTLFLPGSAQLVAGRRDVGRIAMRVWLSVLGALLAVVLIGLVWHGFVFWFACNTVVLGFIRLLLCALAIGWALLFMDAWRLGQPLELLQKQRLAMVGLNGALVFSVAGSLLFASHMVAVQRGFISAMFGDGTATSAHHGRYNVLLLGGDSGSDRWGLRPDSITVASIDADTGKTILFGLPRNMMNFPFAKGSVMEEQFPDGYDCDGCELNSLSTWAQDNKALFKGFDNPGVEATVEGVEGITGLDINYYAMVNLQGFRNMVQAVGGLKLNVRDRIPIGGVGGPVTGLHRAGRPAPQRLPDALVRPLAGERRRLLADGPAEVRDERDAPAALAADRGHELREDRQGQRAAGHHRPARLRARHLRGAGHEGPVPAGRHGLVRAPDDQHRAARTSPR